MEMLRSLKRSHPLLQGRVTRLDERLYLHRRAFRKVQRFNRLG